MNDIVTGAAKLGRPQDVESAVLKQCCAAIYASDAARLLLGSSFHPGGARLTERLGQMLKLTRRARVLDVAAGTGMSAIFLAERFGCEVAGVDYSHQNVAAANAEATAKGLGNQVTFQWADAERLPFPSASFDAVICECAFCTFPDKQAAAREFYRVLASDGRLGLSDLTRRGSLPSELEGLLSWIACIAAAQPLSDYAALLSAAAFTAIVREEHDDALAEFVNQMRTRLLAAEVMAGLQKLTFPGFDFEAAKTIAKHALGAIRAGKLGYAILVATKIDQAEPSRR